MKTIITLFLSITFLSCSTVQTTKNPMNEIDNFLVKQVEEDETPSIHYVIFSKDSIIHKFQFGYSDIRNQKRVSENTTYNAYSVTKTFTALSILQLAEKGKLNIDQPVNKYLPGFPYPSEITIRQLMTHSSGIPNPIPLSWIHLADEHHHFDGKKFFAGIFVDNNKTKSLPNEKYAYSNLGYVLLGQVIEKISGLSYENYIRENIIKPLELDPTELDFEINDIEQHAKGYQKRLSFINLILGFLIDKGKYVDITEGKWNSFKPFYVNGVSYGGLIGTSNAFVKYIQELLHRNSKLISDEYKKILFTENYTNDNKQTGMCFSWFNGKLNGEQYFAHAGGGGGYYCEIRIYPEIGIGSVVMFNRTGVSDERFLDELDKYFMNKK